MDVGCFEVVGVEDDGDEVEKEEMVYVCCVVVVVDIEQKGRDGQCKDC